LEPVTVMPAGVMDLLEGAAVEFAIYLPWFALEGNLRSLGSGDEGVVCVFLILGGIISEPTSA
jgi:hypothetical protein